MKKMNVHKDICTGCRYCEVICSISHSADGRVNPHKARIGVYSDSKNGIDRPNVCRQCDNPQCVTACKFDAISKDPGLGVIRLDKDKCTGCFQCSAVCPFEGVRQDLEERKPLICDLCGGDPMCVKFCRVLAHVGMRAVDYMEPKEFSALIAGLQSKG